MNEQPALHSCTMDARRAAGSLVVLLSVGSIWDHERLLMRSFLIIASLATLRTAPLPPLLYSVLFLICAIEFPLDTSLVLAGVAPLLPHGYCFAGAVFVIANLQTFVIVVNLLVARVVSRLLAIHCAAVAQSATAQCMAICQTGLLFSRRLQLGLRPHEPASTGIYLLVRGGTVSHSLMPHVTPIVSITPWRLYAVRSPVQALQASARLRPQKSTDPHPCYIPTVAVFFRDGGLQYTSQGVPLSPWLCLARTAASDAAHAASPDRRSATLLVAASVVEVFAPTIQISTFSSNFVVATLHPDHRTRPAAPIEGTPPTLMEEETDPQWSPLRIMHETLDPRPPSTWKEVVVAPPPPLVIAWSAAMLVVCAGVGIAYDERYYDLALPAVMGLAAFVPVWIPGTLLAMASVARVLDSTDLTASAYLFWIAMFAPTVCPLRAVTALVCLLLRPSLFPVQVNLALLVGAVAAEWDYEEYAYAVRHKERAERVRSVYLEYWEEPLSLARQQLPAVLYDALLVHVRHRSALIQAGVLSFRHAVVVCLGVEDDGTQAPDGIEVPEGWVLLGWYMGQAILLFDDPDVLSLLEIKVLILRGVARLVERYPNSYWGRGNVTIALKLVAPSYPDARAVPCLQLPPLRSFYEDNGNDAPA